MAPLRVPQNSAAPNATTSHNDAQTKENDEDEDDYLTMVVPDPATTSNHETLTQRRKRLAREAELRAHPKSKAEIAQEERAKREAALAKSSLDTSSKGFKMMAALGYKPGTALGAARKDGSGASNGAAIGLQGDNAVDTRLLEPIGLEMKEGKSGIGADSEKKRKIREAFAEQENAEKKVKVNEGDFRQRQMREREEKRHEGQWWGAMKVAEKLDEEGDVDANTSAADNTTLPEKFRINASSKPLKNINLLWRLLVRHRIEADRDRRMRSDMNDFLSPTPHQVLAAHDSDGHTELEPDDKIALGLSHDALFKPASKAVSVVDDLDLDEDDEELDAYIALPVDERLEKVIIYLRQQWRYCFWCKFRYQDEQMEGCPGLTEDDHD